ncbi:putative membrane protein YkvI [Streptomyces sp. V4I8]|uniref:hypothetical protein n=1 Tax=Streptomyces sp. V4I8 TaxID=3156469 RepID=UPI003514FBC7
MPAITFVFAVFVIGFEQLVQWKYGPMGIIGLLLLTIGLKARSPALSSVGALVLAALVTRPAL